MGVDVQRQLALPRPGHAADQGRGLPVTIFRPGLEGDPDKPHKGVINFIDNAIDPTTSTVLVRAEVANPEASSCRAST